MLGVKYIVIGKADHEVKEIEDRKEKWQQRMKRVITE